MSEFDPDRDADSEEPLDTSPLPGPPEEGLGDGEPFAGWSSELRAAPPRIRPQHRRVHEEFRLPVTLTSLMDATTIILIYLLKAFASSSIAVPDQSLRLPVSTAQMRAEEAATVLISPSKIVVNDRFVATIEAGKVDPALKRGGAQGYFIEPLFDAMAEEAENEKRIAEYNTRKPFKGVALILADRSTPYRLITEVLYTVGQAGFGNYRFAVIKKD